MIIFCILVSVLIAMLIITVLVLIKNIYKSNAQINNNHDLVFAVIDRLANRVGLDSYYNLKYYDINDLHDNLFQENDNYIGKKLDKFKHNIEEYLDIELERIGHVSPLNGAILIEKKYCDKKFNKLKLLYDHLNLDVETIQAQPLQYKVVKKKK